MPDIQDTLSTFAEISVALAGFSGIVIAFGRRSIGSLGKLEVRRLSNLFILSGLVLVFSLLGISLLHLDLEDSNILGLWGSTAVLLLATPWLIWDVINVYKLEKAEKALVNPAILFTFYSLTVAMLLLQLVNLALFKALWPFFLAMVLIVVGAFQQFILLVRMGLVED
jgi:hypothetical protein